MAELKHLHTAWDVDRHIVLDSAEKLIIIRFSGYENPPAAALMPSFSSSPSSPSPDTTHLSSAAGNSKAHIGDLEEQPTKKARREGQETGPAPVAVVAGMEHYLRTQQMDALLVQLAPKVRKYCLIYAVDTNEVPQFNAMYELGHDRDPFAVMFFYRNQHIRVDVGTGNNNKINFFAFEDWEEDFLPIVNAAYRAGKIGKNMASSDKKFSTVSLRR